MLAVVRRVLCFFVVLLLLFSPLGAKGILAAQKPEPAVIETNIGIPPRDYKKMISTKEENRFPVAVSVDQGPVHTGQIHIRGSSSKEMGFATKAKRLPVQIKFNSAAFFSDQIANTCVKFNNAITPSRLLGQYLAYEMFEFLNIPTPSHSFAFLQYNDVDFGLYFALENINEEFLRKHFSKPFGSLYKGTDEPDDQPYFQSSFFGGLLAKADHGSERLLALLDSLDRGEGYEEYLNVDEVLRFFACTAAYGGDNSILTELTSFFLYEDNGKFILLPWDNSEAFFATPTNNGIDHFRLEFWEDAPPCALFDLLMQKEENKALYHTYLKEINEHFLDPETMDPYVQSLASLISPYLLRDHTMFFNAPYELPVTPEEDLGSVGAFLQTLHRIHDNLSAQLNGTEDVFYSNPAHQDMPAAEDDFDQFMAYLLANSPSVNLNITKEICGSYSSYCQKRGIDYADASAELPIAVILFVGFVCITLAAVCVVLAIRKRKHRENAMGEHRKG